MRLSAAKLEWYSPRDMDSNGSVTMSAEIPVWRALSFKRLRRSRSHNLCVNWNSIKGLGSRV